VVGPDRSASGSGDVSRSVPLITDRYPPFSLSPVDGHPVRFEVDYPQDGRISRWRPLVHWLLAIPAVLILYVISVVAFFVWIIAIFVILFTARLPHGLFDVALVYLRWNARVICDRWVFRRHPEDGCGLSTHAAAARRARGDRWVQRFAPLLADAARFARHRVGHRWHVDETYVKLAGRWVYVYCDRPVRAGHRRVRRRPPDTEAARRFFHRARTTTGVAPVEVVANRAPTDPNVLGLEGVPLAGQGAVVGRACQAPRLHRSGRFVAGGQPVLRRRLRRR
jgi:DDE domain/Domain of unknown function (DUF4389)